MKYMLIMQGKWGDWDENGIAGWTEDAVKDHIDFMRTVNKELQEAGEFVQGEGLAPPDQAKIIHADTDGSPAITDGPVRRVEGVPRRLVDPRRREPGARLRHRRSHLDRSRPRRQASEHAHRSARSDAGARPGDVTPTSDDVVNKDLLRELAPQVLGALMRGTGTSMMPRTRCRKRSSPRRSNGPRKEHRTNRAPG